MATTKLVAYIQKVRIAGAFVVLVLLSWIAPRLAARWLDHAFWHRPLRFPEPERERVLRKTAELLTITHSSRPVAVYIWGQGPLILMVHGWSGRGLQFGAFIEPLVQQGYRVITFDAPAHGRSPGRYTNFPTIAEVMEKIIGEYGPLHAIIAHSAGCTPALLVAQRSATLKRMICISPYASLHSPLRDLYRQLRVPARVRQAHERGLFAKYGAAMYEKYSPVSQVSTVHAHGLVVHDDEDPELASSEARTLHHAWPGSKLVITRGLGHYRLLRDVQVVREVVEFVGVPERIHAAQVSEA